MMTTWAADTEPVDSPVRAKSTIEYIPSANSAKLITSINAPEIPRTSFSCFIFVSRLLAYQYDIILLSLCMGR